MNSRELAIFEYHIHRYIELRLDEIDEEAFMYGKLVQIQTEIFRERFEGELPLDDVLKVRLGFARVVGQLFFNVAGNCPDFEKGLNSFCCFNHLEAGLKEALEVAKEIKIELPDEILRPYLLELSVRRFLETGEIQSLSLVDVDKFKEALVQIEDRKFEISNEPAHKLKMYLRELYRAVEPPIVSRVQLSGVPSLSHSPIKVNISDSKGSLSQMPLKLEADIDSPADSVDFQLRSPLKLREFTQMLPLTIEDEPFAEDVVNEPKSSEFSPTLFSKICAEKAVQFEGIRDAIGVKDDKVVDEWRRCFQKYPRFDSSYFLSNISKPQSTAHKVPFATPKASESPIDKPVRIESRKRKRFSEEEVDNLIKGMKRFGNRWALILASYKFENRTAVDLKDKARNLSQKS